MNRISLGISLLAVLLAAAALVRSSTDRRNGRFQMKQDDSSIGFDTRTGQVCLTAEFVSQKVKEIPACKNLQ
jgi:hypothetical protein